PDVTPALGSPVEQLQDQPGTPPAAHRVIAELLARDQQQILAAWVARGATVAGPGGVEGLEREGPALLDALRAALAAEAPTQGLAAVGRLVSDFSLRRTRAGAQPAQTAALILGLREALLAQLEDAAEHDRFAAAREAARI